MAIKSNALHLRIARLLRSVFDIGVLLHPFKMMHYYGYSHVKPLRQISRGADTRIAPNTSFRNGERIVLGDQVQLGERCSLWAGRSSSWIRVGDRTTFGPDCYVTAANYGLAAGKPILDQEMTELDVTIGQDCWIGTKVVITAGVTLGDGCVIGAHSVVTKDIPPGTIAAGSPARVLKDRQ